ncbi:MAG: pantetheine-phosphate adenylyltransferase [Verrucomicrobiae bacterium]|nr:pantetheine-phosphate adenylyltransferase [Verrucomicrobiae bacterium]
MKEIAVYPGTFDPITNGHVDVVRRAARIFSQVIVAVAHNVDKTPLFTAAERVALARASLRGFPNVLVEEFVGLLADYARQRRAHVVIRGLRAVSDFEFELQMASINRRLNPALETIFLMPQDEYMFISSRTVKEIAALGGSVRGFVPPVVERALRKKLG